MPHATSSRLSWLGIGRELIPGVPVLPTAAIPVDQDAYEPQDVPNFILDTGVRAAMGAVAGAVAGTQQATFAFGAPFYPDTGGWWLDNLLGDTSTVQFSGLAGASQGLTEPLSAGDTTLYAAASLGAVTAGSVIAITDPSPAACEVVVATAGSTGTVVRFAGTPCRFPHSGATASLLGAGGAFTHTFAALNAGSGQPPVHTLTDTSGLTAGGQARTYPSAVVTQIDLAGDPARGFITGKVSGVSWQSAPTTAAPVNPGYSAVPGFPGWFSQVSVGGAGAGTHAEAAWALSMKRETVVYRSAGNTLTPWIIARGPLAVTGTLTYPGAFDETPLVNMTSGAQPSVQVSASNGLTGASALSMAFLVSVAQFTQAKPDRSQLSIGWGTAFQAVDSALNAGGSGGLSPVQVTLTNTVAAY